MLAPSIAPPFAIWPCQLFLLTLYILLCAQQTLGSPTIPDNVTSKRFNNENQHAFSTMTNTYNDGTAGHTALKSPSDGAHKRIDTLSAMINALDVMQEEYFEVWQGVWPTGIDWTSAVLGTHVSAALSTLSKSSDYMVTSESALSPTDKAHENLINRYFSQLVASYFGQDHFQLRNEAYDDMLWVVLGWLESINFIELHSDLHYKEPQRPLEKDTSKHSSWYGKQWISSFAHRARIFWDLASKGWDRCLCDGGMIWNPHLTPYKNAITNELFITASISMYLYFPGDDNPAPFIDATGPPVGPRDPKYLAAAVEAYKWLNFSNMTNEKGLYVDGFHISGWERHPLNGTQRNTKCDSRNNMVYTYNQGVLLSGQRGLWEATGARSYLDEGHDLIMSVINATGYDLKRDKPYEDGIVNPQDRNLGKWYGIGRSGIMEEGCDSRGDCSQDAQTFKGIFFHHLTLFCAPLPQLSVHSGDTINIMEFHDLKTSHHDSCARYGGWIKRNAKAAMTTRNDNGMFGMWWGAPFGSDYSGADELQPELPRDAIDYRNHGVPRDGAWQDRATNGGPRRDGIEDISQGTLNPSSIRSVKPKDANDRDRGRTVETQSGGLAVLRALWEVVDVL